MTSEGAEPVEPGFEQILARLREVVEQLEGGSLPLEQSLTVFEEGIRLSRLGARRLDEAERRIEELVGDDPHRTRALAPARAQRGARDDE
ncbi:MAG: exodeoxyribonuclease VII small subunit [Sandaracinaceae bacterium]|nr:exodeoxyribonuclease VII small subunit [Sandaracinaceae bacterium]